MLHSQRVAAKIPIHAWTTIIVVHNSTHNKCCNCFIRSEINTLTACCSGMLYASFSKSGDLNTERLPFEWNFWWECFDKWYCTFCTKKKKMGMCCIICQKSGLFWLKNKWNGLFSLALVIVDKWYRNFREFRSKREKWNTSKGITFFPKTFHRDEPFHLNSLRNYRKFHSNGKRSLICAWTTINFVALTNGWIICSFVFLVTYVLWQHAAQY